MLEETANVRIVFGDQDACGGARGHVSGDLSSCGIVYGSYGIALDSYMTRVLLLIALVFTLIGSPVAHAQLNPKVETSQASPAGAVRADTMHLTVLSSISDPEAAPGKRLTITFNVTPKKLMHVYAPGKHDYQVVGVKIDEQPWLRVQPTKYPPSEIYHFKELDEKVETYGKPFTLVQEVAILATPEALKALAASPTVKIAGKLEYQACDDKVCYAPTRVPVSFTLNVK